MCIRSKRHCLAFLTTDGAAFQPEPRNPMNRVIGGLFLTLLSCTDHRSVSYTKEQIDSANSLITRYGLSEMPKYDELTRFTKIYTKNEDGTQRFPWVDTYWPTYEKNLARRWGAIVQLGEDNQSPFDYYVASFFQTQIDVMAKPELHLNLSPSEKFDILYRSQNAMQLSSDNENLKRFYGVEARHRLIHADGGVAQDSLKANRQIAREYLGVFNRSPLLNSLQSLSPMTSEGLVNWLARSVNEKNVFPGVSAQGESWKWEGICHGWAAASVMEQEPKHAVRVEFGKGQDIHSVIFTEGDIRALISKSWAESRNTDQFFIGRRCEKNVADPSLGVPSNQQGRAVTGSLSYKVDGAFKTGFFTVVQDYPTTKGTKALSRIILENEWVEASTPKFAYLLREGPSRSATYRVFSDEKAAFSAAEGNPDASEGGAEAKSIEYFGCSDVNPASFHSVLVENIEKRNLGLVMDRTQTGQVWNQPIGAADFEIGPLQSLSEVKDKDAAKSYRAPGTAFIAEVKATVHWGTEPDFARFTYTAENAEADLSFGTDGDLDKSFSTTTVYTYTLEFDHNQVLIGGEWGALGQLKPEVENPDFLFGFSRKAGPVLDDAGYLKSGYETIINKIHACSLEAKIDGQVDSLQYTDFELFSRKLDYSDCKLD